MSRSASLGFLVAAYVVMAWVVTSLARGKGLVLMAGALVVLALGLQRRRAGRPDLLYRATFLLVLATTTVGGMEAVLAFFPGVLRGRVANFVFHGYHGERDGIYRADDHLGVALRPSFRRSMYWNGHWWTHETNRRGLRGPEIDRAETIFLGDSMIYGHGVSGDETVAARYAALTATPVANLGVQGMCPVQYLRLLRTKGLALGPRRVFVCYHPNDAADILSWYGRDELERFLTTPDYAPLVREAIRAAPGIFDFWALDVALPLRLSRLLRAIVKPPKDAAISGPVGSSTGQRFVPSERVLEEPFPPTAANADREQQLAWRVARHALIEMRRVTEAAGAQLVLFDIGYPRAFTRAVEALAAETGVAYSPAGRVALEHALAGEEVYLLDDGHWTARGSAVVAEDLARRTLGEAHRASRPLPAGMHAR